VPLATALFLAQLAATLAMTGLIWFVQVVHYPLFAGVAEPAGAHGWRAYAAAHGRRTTWVVAAPMLVELAASLAMLRWRPAFVPPHTAWLGAALVAVVWASTALLQVPRHDELGRGWAPRAHRRLVQGNWVRTGAWTARAFLLLQCLAAAIG
jgi:hypothetical protein